MKSQAFFIPVLFGILLPEAGISGAASAGK
jgi:hypothetical protein